jgi:hypothetical protein
MTETISESSDRDGRHEQPPVDDSVRCPGCETSRQWRQYDVPPADMNAVGTCPDCGTHILGFDTITAADREELHEVLHAISGERHTDGENGRTSQ